jgi:hypothetical protein
MSASNLRATLVAYTALTNLVGNRIVSDRAEQTTERPFIAFELDETEYIEVLNGGSEVWSETFHIACFADKRVEAEQIADQVEAALSTQKVIGRTNDFIPDLDIHVTDVHVRWFD